MPRLEGPRVFVPPPLIFVAGWALAWAFDLSLTFDIDGRGISSAQATAGVMLLVAGLGCMAWALLTFVQARTPVVPIRPARLLVTRGPFRFSRNPMYVGLTVAYVGLAVLLNKAWPLVFLPAVLTVLVTLVIRREERYLRSAFPGEYEAYCRHVRRWL